MAWTLLFLLCLVLPNSFGTDQPSFRSSLNEGGKPILRMAPEMDEEIEEVEEEKADGNSLGSLATSLLESLRSMVSDLFSGKRLARTRPPPTPPPEPEWLYYFKNFVKDALHKDPDHSDDHLRPLIEWYERVHRVIIQNVDGEIIVKWKPKPTDEHVPIFG